MKFLLKLYPAAWRERYGAELQTLISDAHFGWRDSLDLVPSALKMRLRRASDAAIAISFWLAGILTAFGLWYLRTPPIQAHAAIQITQSGVPDNNAAVLALARRAALADEMLQRNLRIRILAEESPGPSRTLTIQFGSPDADQALNTTNTLINRITQIVQFAPNRTGITRLDVLQRPHLIHRSFAKSRNMILGAGSIAGLFLGIVVLCTLRILQTDDFIPARLT